jgi:RNA recognition motif-containing protein
MAASSTSLSSKSGAAGPLSNKRLFVGNLAETADEYTLIRFLSKHGKISKFDYLFHKAGPKKGRPRGYAFVEYATPEVGGMYWLSRL